MVYALTWLADVPRKAGLKVAEQPDWQTRGHGDSGKILGIVMHHTAGPKTGNAPSLGVVTNGRPAAPGVTALAGPLCHYHLGRDGTVTVVAAGRPYHAGSGSYRGVSDGNMQMIGIEAENTGLGEPWEPVQYDAYVRLCAAILDYIGAETIMCCAHREWTTRKIDPTGIDMPAFRLAVAGVRNGAIVRPPIPAKDATGRPTLRRGAKGDAVRELQTAIGVKPADASYGPTTEAAVRSYQRKHGLVPDGLTGPAVWASLDMKAAA